ncbi:MAG: serine protease [Bacteroidota bacterium]|nr:serine protease [Bacteroidota bacterium]
MKNGKSLFGMILLIVFLFLLSNNCSNKTYNKIYPTLSDGKYDSEFPYRNCSTQLQDIIKSVKKIICTAEYTSYVFLKEKKISINDLSKEVIEANSIKKEISIKSKSGTATIISASMNHVALLTCSHISSFPDTIITYYAPLYSGAKKYIFSLSIKTGQKQYGVDIPGSGELSILAIDEKNDIAVLGCKIDIESTVHPPKVFNYKFGNSKDLEWGSFVYIIGYPKGRKMITRGIVSSPNRDNSGSFLIDALFNEGISGGMILAIRDGVPNFEFVGIAKSVSIDTKYILRPFQSGYEYSNPNIPYQGEFCVHKDSEINYGITYAVSNELIRLFFKKNKEKFQQAGYDFSSIFKDDKN